jgi:hypothetical protein
MFHAAETKINHLRIQSRRFNTLFCEAKNVAPVAVLAGASFGEVTVF